MIEIMLYNLNIDKLLWIIKKRIMFIMIFAIMGTGITGYYALKTQQEFYYANASFYVFSNPEYATLSKVNLSWNDLNTANALVNSYLIVLKSDTVLEKIIDRLSINYSSSALAGMISSSAVEDTAVFSVIVQNENPELAMEIANAIAEIAPKEISRIVKAGGIEVIDEAKLPTNSYPTNNVMKYACLGGIVGFGASTFIFICIGLMDMVIRKKKDVEDKFNIPILGCVPNFDQYGKKDSEGKLLSNNSPFAIKETYSFISTNLLFTSKGDKCPVYAVTSAREGEGKTLNCINMAKGIAKLGKKVLIIDADMRKSYANKNTYKDVSNCEGLSLYLAGIIDTPNFIDSKADSLSFILSGELPPNPAELLSSERMDLLINEMRSQYDCIFIDFPPLGLCSDALQPMDLISGYLLVIRAGYSKINEVVSTTNRLEEIKANICGIIYNDDKSKIREYTYSSSSYFNKKERMNQKDFEISTLEKILDTP